MYLKASSKLSSKPACFAIWLPGIQIPAPDVAELPPQSGAFSIINTSFLLLAATRAFNIPPAPEPTTNTSTSLSHPSAIGLHILHYHSKYKRYITISNYNWN